MGHEEQVLGEATHCKARPLTTGQELEKEHNTAPDFAGLYPGEFGQLAMLNLINTFHEKEGPEYRNKYFDRGLNIFSNFVFLP